MNQKEHREIMNQKEHRHQASHLVHAGPAPIGTVSVNATQEVVFPLLHIAGAWILERCKWDHPGLLDEVDSAPLRKTLREQEIGDRTDAAMTEAIFFSLDPHDPLDLFALALEDTRDHGRVITLYVHDAYLVADSRRSAKRAHRVQQLFSRFATEELPDRLRSEDKLCS